MQTHEFPQMLLQSETSLELSSFSSLIRTHDQRQEQSISIYKSILGSHYRGFRLFIDEKLQNKMLISKHAGPTWNLLCFRSDSQAYTPLRLIIVTLLPASFFFYTSSSFHKSLCDSRSPRCCRTLLTNISSAVIWTVSILPPISSSLSLFYKFFAILPSALSMIGITVIFGFCAF